MSRLAREHPEDERYQSLEGQREVYEGLSDREKPSEQDTCRYWGCDLIEGVHRPGCRLFVPVD